MTYQHLIVVAFICLSQQAQAQLSPKLPPIFDATRAQEAQPDPTVRRYLSPVKILWRNGTITNAEQLLKPGNGQADLSGKNMCSLKSDGQVKPGVLLDFGKELHGGLQIITGQWKESKPHHRSDSFRRIGQRGNGGN